MVRIDRLLLGYVTVSFQEEARREVMNALIGASLCAAFSEKNSFDVSLFMLPLYKKALASLPVTVSEVRGLTGFVFSLRKRYGIICALVLLSVYYLFIGRFVWDVRIEGNEEVSQYEILAELEAAGLFIGADWSALSQDKVESTALAASENIGWLNINRRGNVAYVTVREKNVPSQIIDNGGYSNIVAAEDCVIDSINVKSGIAMVKAGDTVRQGQLLISGIIPAELGGGAVRAEGEIVGRVRRDITVSVPRCEVRDEYADERLYEMSVKIFNFSVNIFKSYGKTDSSCAIIEDTEECVIFGRYRLPLEIRKIYVQEQTKAEHTYTDSELVSIASVRLSKLRLAVLAEAEVLRIGTYGEFTDDGYRMSSGITALYDVGKETFFMEPGGR